MNLFDNQFHKNLKVKTSYFSIVTYFSLNVGVSVFYVEFLALLNVPFLVLGCWNQEEFSEVSIYQAVLTIFDNIMSVAKFEIRGGVLRKKNPTKPVFLLFKSQQKLFRKNNSNFSYSCCSHLRLTDL